MMVVNATGTVYLAQNRQKPSNGRSPALTKICRIVLDFDTPNLQISHHFKFFMEIKIVQAFLPLYSPYQIGLPNRRLRP